MNASDAIARLLGSSSTPGRVREVAVPPAARRLSTLPRVDYEDAFLIDVGPAPDRTPEQWARVILEDAPITLRGVLRSGWFALGLKRGSARSERSVLGWEVLRGTPEFVLLAGRSPVGLSAELLIKRQQHNLLYATLLQQENPIARAVWAGVAPVHRPVVRYVLEQGSRR
jgi:Protein of unknown function (DUF2867)